MYNALAVANFYLELAKQHRQKIDPMKLQKLTFMAHGWHLALYDKPLLDEDVQAYQYGPVVLSLYHEFKRFGVNPIEVLATDYDPQNEELFNPRIPLNDEKAIALLMKVWNVYSAFSSLELANMTHQPGSAWAEARTKNPSKRIVGMDDRDIKAEFSSKVKVSG